MRSMEPPMRAFLGFVAGALSVLIFHQGVWALFHLGGLMPPHYQQRRRAASPSHARSSGTTSGCYPSQPPNVQALPLPGWSVTNCM